MKKIIGGKIIALGLIVVALITTYYLYQQGQIAFLPGGEKKEVATKTTIEAPFTDKKHEFSYQDRADLGFDIAKFKESENWYGEGEFDYSTFYDGESSMFLTSLGGRKASISLRKSFDIESVVNFKFIVYLATEPVDIEEFNLIFAGRGFRYKFPIRDITKGWNLLVLPREKFSKDLVAGSGGNAFGMEIETVLVELVSRPKARSTVNLDVLWAEKGDEFLKDWNIDSENFLSTKDPGGLLAIGMIGHRATLKKGSGKNYTIQAKFTPLNAGSFGFFLRGDYKSGYGYYLMMSGVNTDAWHIYKYGPFEERDQFLNLGKGKISNFKMEKEQSYWLKAELKRTRLFFYFSSDGENFSKLGEVEDGSFGSGGIGIAIEDMNMVFIDNLQFSQN